MSNSALSVAGTPETVRLSVPEQTTTDCSQKAVQKPRLYKIRAAYIINVFIILIGKFSSFLYFYTSSCFTATTYSCNTFHVLL